MTVEVPYITMLPLPRCTALGCCAAATHRVHFDVAQGGYDAGFVGEYCLEHASRLIDVRTPYTEEPSDASE